jgi:hypothetical protein
VRLLVIALLRAGKIEATSKGQVIDSALSLEARTTFTNNNLFRQASFRPRTTDCEFTDYIEAGEAYKTCFGKEIQEYEENSHRPGHPRDHARPMRRPCGRSSPSSTNTGCRGRGDCRGTEQHRGLSPPARLPGAQGIHRLPPGAERGHQARVPSLPTH